MNSVLHFTSAVVAFVFALSRTAALDPHQLELKQHYEHLAYIADFPCLHPQPKVIPVTKLFSESQSHGKAYFPDVTVLHRCDECTGSCTSGHKCAGKVTELVLLPFKATYLHDTEKHKVGSWAMEYHELLNHTVCGCAVPPPKESCQSDMEHKPHSSSSGQHGGGSSGGSNYGSGGSSGSSNGGGSNYGSGGSSGSSNGGGSNYGPGGSSGSSNSGSGSSGGSNGGDYSSSTGSDNGLGTSSGGNYESSGSPSGSSNNGNANEESSGVNSEVTGSPSTTEDYIQALFERSKP